MIYWDDKYSFRALQYIMWHDNHTQCAGNHSLWSGCPGRVSSCRFIYPYIKMSRSKWSNLTKWGFLCDGFVLGSWFGLRGVFVCKYPQNAHVWISVWLLYRRLSVKTESCADKELYRKLTELFSACKKKEKKKETNMLVLLADISTFNVMYSQDTFF